MTAVPHSFVFSESTCGVCKGTNSSAKAGPKAILRAITHKGDALKADEEGDRFDAGTEGIWATRKHRTFLIHSVAAAAARALFSALATESRNRRPRCLFPSAKPDRNFASIHRPDIRKLATATPPCATTFCRPRLRLPPTGPRPRPHNVS